ARLTPPPASVIVPPLSSAAALGELPMIMLCALLLGLAMPPATDAPAPTAADPARLREMLQDRQHPRSQSQAALLLLQASGRWAAAGASQLLWCCSTSCPATMKPYASRPPKPWPT